MQCERIKWKTAGILQHEFAALIQSLLCQCNTGSFDWRESSTSPQICHLRGSPWELNIVYLERRGELVTAIVHLENEAILIAWYQKGHSQIFMRPWWPSGYADDLIYSRCDLHKPVRFASTSDNLFSFDYLCFWKRSTLLREKIK